MIQVHVRAGAIALICAVLAGSTAAGATHPKRTFYCGDGQGEVQVTVLNRTSIRAVVDMYGSADGKFTMTMHKQGSGFHFVKDEYEITIDGTQNILSYSAPDFGDISCTWGGS